MAPALLKCGVVHADGYSMEVKRRLGGLPLSAYVLSLLALPLAAVGVLSFREVATNNVAVDGTNAFAAAAQIHAGALEAVIPIEIERTTVLTLSVIDDFGVGRDAVRAAGFEFAAVSEANSVLVDEALVQLGSTLVDPKLIADHAGVVEDLARTRAAVSTGTSSVESVVSAYDRALDFLFEVLSSSRASMSEIGFVSVETVAAQDRLDMVTPIVTTGRAELESFANYIVRPGSVRPVEIATHEERHVEAVLAMESTLPDEVSEIVRRLEALPSLSAFGDIEVNPRSPGFELANVLEIGNALSTHLAYLEDVAEFASDQAAQLRSRVELSASEAQRRNRATLVSLMAIGILSIGFAVLVIRSFARPLNFLRLQAERLSGGELGAEPLLVDGPSDIRKVTIAVNDMAGTLALVEDHMRALAGAEEMSSPRLRELPGQVGASVRVSMERLTALTQSLQISEAKLVAEARLDNLTGLPNRFAVLEHLERVVRSMDAAVAKDGSARVVGVMFVDVDGFKSVNDSHGHVVGDVVLREIAQRLKRSIRDVDYVARLGGDEFIVVVDEVVPERLAGFGERLISQIEQPYSVGDQVFVVSASVGATLMEPGDSGISAIERADAAVYQAKQRGRRRVEMFDKELQRSIERQAEIELGLRQAIQHGELRLFLQPLADLRTGLPSGAEALVRWERPGHGLIPPSAFIPIAERSGLIFELERWVLDAACRRLAEWGSMGHGEGLRLAVNISGRHLIEGDLIADLDQALRATGADPNMLSIELTESHLLDDVERASAVLRAVRSRGVKVAIDDFGTGYSSMTYLQRLPIDIVKIDRSFIASATMSAFDATIVDMVVKLGRALAFDVVAEGIETLDQLTYVLKSGVAYGQGYVLARPMPASEAELVIFNGPLFDARALAPATPVGLSVGLS